jgi:hypothetical protein
LSGYVDSIAGLHNEQDQAFGAILTLVFVELPGILVLGVMLNAALVDGLAGYAVWVFTGAAFASIDADGLDQPAHPAQMSA